MIVGGRQADWNWCSSDMTLKTTCWQKSLFLREPQSFLLGPSIERMKLTHIMEGNLLYSKSTNLDVNLI